MARKSLKSGQGSASSNAARAKSRSLTSASWFDKSLNTDPAYVGMTTVLRKLEREGVSGDTPEERRKNFRRTVRAAVKRNLPKGAKETDWEIVDKVYYLPFDLTASLNADGSVTIAKIDSDEE